MVHNFVRVHFTTRQVPAVALGMLDHGFALHEVFLMMYGFQQIVTQTERCDNFVVHGLAPPEVKWVISLSM